MNKKGFSLDDFKEGRRLWQCWELQIFKKKNQFQIIAPIKSLGFHSQVLFSCFVWLWRKRFISETWKRIHKRQPLWLNWSLRGRMLLLAGPGWVCSWSRLCSRRLWGIPPCPAQLPASWSAFAASEPKVTGLVLVHIPGLTQRELCDKERPYRCQNQLRAGPTLFPKWEPAPQDLLAPWGATHTFLLVK